MENLRVTNTVEIPELELTWRFSRSSGPGGQHVNTSDSRVELRFDVANSGAFTPAQRERVLEQLESRLVDGVVTVAASRFRSQYRNRQDALERLSALLAGALAPPAPPRRATKPSRRARQRRVDEKRQRGELKKLRRNPDQ
ncbi:ribosome-associated protein [Stackebrandtia endophytica]|uniref:Ribosome-associated protein n=1 Tax=Stackebrandtia endophytica TaxID=1496996 RepID=A0A543AX16_9ACTN|nr:ribosome-associated protein [Stackebrandtia endophytica]